MKHSRLLKGAYLTMSFVVISSFSFGQKYTGLTAVSSDASPSANFACDGNIGNSWQDALNLDTSWITFDLGSVKNVNSIKIYWEAANAKAYSLSFSTDNTNFTGTLNYPNMAAGNRTDLVSGLNIDCRYIKMQGITRQLAYGYRIFEFEAYPAVISALTSLSLAPATSTIILGQTEQLTVGGLDQLGNPFALTNTTTWSVNGTGASVSSTGLFSSTSKGFYTVTATNSTLTKTATIEVLPANPNLSIATGVSATATASSGTAASAFDNNGGTRWGSATTDPQWIMVDLLGLKTISDILITWETANAKDYIIEASTDNVTWSTKITKTGMPSGSRTDRMYDVNFDARYIRLTGTARTTAYGYSIWELQIYGVASLGTSVSTMSANSSAIYPNPATDKIFVSGNVAEVAFYSLQGQLVRSVKNINTVNVSAFSKGLYLVKVTDRVGNQQSSKLEIR